jgi:DNA modification methylase
MEIIKVSVSEISPAPYNPRRDLQPNDPEYKKIEASLDEFGLVDPLIYNPTTKNLIGGHQRFKILIRKGIKEVWAVPVPLSLEREKMLNVALNGAHGDWVKDKLAALLEEFTQIPDFKIEATGFSPVETSQLVERYLKKPDEDDFDAVKDAESVETPITQKNEIVKLGPHRILCGDCSIALNIERLMAREKAGLVHTDPPYNVAYMGGNRPNPKARPKKSKAWPQIYFDNMDDQKYWAWLKIVLTYIRAVMDEGSALYMWNGHKNFGPMHSMLESLDFHVSSVIVWAKPNFAISYADYHEQVEFCLYSWLKDNGTHKWFGSVTESTLWEVKRDPTKDYCHPTQKPVALPYKAIINSSVKGDVVLDTFLGSGSTLIACESLGRRCYACELDPRYVDAVVRRYIAYVGKDKVSPDLVSRYIKED